MKENINNDCVGNVKNIKTSNELVKKIPGSKIYPSTAQKSEFESPREGSKRINRKVDFNIARSLNITLGLKGSGKKVCFFNSVILVLYSLPAFR